MVTPTTLLEQGHLAVEYIRNEHFLLERDMGLPEGTGLP